MGLDLLFDPIEPALIVGLHAIEYMLGRRRASRVESGQPRLVAMPFLEQRREFAHGIRRIGHPCSSRDARSAFTSVAPSWLTLPSIRAVTIIRAACSKLSMRWCASSSVRPIVV